MSENSYFALANQYSDFQKQLIESMGEISEEKEVDMVQLEKEITEKTDSVVSWDKYLNQQKERIKDEIENLQTFLKQLGTAQDRYNNYILSCMDNMKVDEIEGNEYVIKRKKPTKVVSIVDEKKLPNKFIVAKEMVTYTPDKREIIKTLKEGTKVPGAELIDGKKSITFKLKKILTKKKVSKKKKKPSNNVE